MRRCHAGCSIVLLVTALFATTVTAGEVTSLVLVNAKTNKPIGPLKDGDTIDLAKVGGRLNVVAAVRGQVGSVQFALDEKSKFRTESTAPFSLAGDTNGNFGNWTPSRGKHTIVATPFDQGQARGEQGRMLSVSFRVVGKPAGDLTPIVYPELSDETVFESMDLPPGPPEVSGELRKWHKITLTFDGPDAAESSVPNPFLDYRLNVLFRQGDRTCLVPGYYAADGNAGQTGAVGRQ